MSEEKKANIDSNGTERQCNDFNNEEEQSLNSLLNTETKDLMREETSTFKSLGVCDILCEACDALNWKKPSKIQVESIPLALQGRDVIGLAETGSGKTGAFVLPILQVLLDNPQRLFALILTPTRELAFQINDQIKALGTSFGVTTATIVGGMDMMTQSLALAKRPHIIIATPGRLVDHLENTKGFHLRTLKFLVLDEADRILNMDFEKEVDTILRVIPKERRTFMFSATMTSKIQKLQRASLKDPIRVEVSSKYKTVDNLKQYYLFIPVKYKDCYLVYILNSLQGNSFIVFCNTCNQTQRIALMLRNLGFNAIPLHGQMSQAKRLGALNKFRSKARSILLATDVASRGLDIPHVDLVINYDIPTHSKDYIHRVGRTARAGRYGKAITLVSQYDVELYQRIEHLIGKQLPKYDTIDEEVMLFQERVLQAQRFAKNEMNEQKSSKHSKHSNNDDDVDDVCSIYQFFLTGSANQELDLKWIQFKKTYHRKYHSVSEENYRKQIFLDNVEFITKHNLKYAQGLSSYNLSINRFTDMTVSEFRGRMNGVIVSKNVRSASSLYKDNDIENLPNEIDWTRKGVVTPIKNQGNCGSCWAFSAVAAIESAHALKKKKLIQLSEQQLVDCSDYEGNMGCEGGWMDNAFQFVIDNDGIDTEDSYPYQGYDETCSEIEPNKTIGAKIQSYVDVKHSDEQALQSAVAKIGPVSAAIDASSSNFMFYKAGVYDHDDCSTTWLDHGITIVGYGKLNEKEFWKVKNSWGTDWGMNGFILMSRNKDNQCGIASQASYPVI